MAETALNGEPKDREEALVPVVVDLVQAMARRAVLAACTVVAAGRADLLQALAATAAPVVVGLL
jgi:hypothetical protein